MLKRSATFADVPAEWLPQPRPPMIQLTRLNNARLALNSDLIKYVEEAPDTVITLLNGEKLVVRETTSQVIERVLEFRRAIVRGAGDGPPGDSRNDLTYPHCFANAPPCVAEPNRG
jgi:uncharacterized protein YlzI (FlbEa/FlbD family)